MESKDDHEHKKFTVLMLPWLAHGHISPFLDLAKKLTQRNFHIYFCSTAINLSSIGQEQQLINSASSSIQLVEFHLPLSFPNLPPHYHTTKSLPPHLMPTLKLAFDMSSPSFSDLLTTLRPNLVIYDFIPPWAPSVASRENILAVQFLTVGAAFLSYFQHKFRNPPSLDEFPFPSIYLTQYEQEKIYEMMKSSPKSGDLHDSDRFRRGMELSTSFILLKTFKEIEAKYLDYLSSVARKNFLPVGPLVHEEPDHEVDDSQHNDHKFIEWLVNKDESSVVFVSFGSEYFMSKDEIEEIAYGLELSKVNFIWVIRFHEEDKHTSIDEALPKRFMERIGEKGMVVEGWAPQGKILRNASVGGFLSHCGWNSVMESMKFGVPIIALPMQIDQPLNARLMVELGLGIEVKKGDEDGRIERREVARVIQEVMMGKEEGEIVRRGAKEMSEKIKEKGEKEMDVVVEKLTQLCEKKNISTPLGIS